MLPFLVPLLHHPSVVQAECSAEYPAKPICVRRASLCPHTVVASSTVSAARLASQTLSWQQSPNTHPQMLGTPVAMLSCRCAEAFVASGRHEAAVRLLVKGRQVERALDLLVANEVPLTEELAESLTPQKTADNVDQRNAVLLRLAQVWPTPPHKQPLNP